MAKKPRPTPREDTEALAVEIEQLTQEVRILRQAIDEFREDFTHLLRNLPDNLPPPYQHLTTLADSFALDYPQRPASADHPDLGGEESHNRMPRRATLFD